MGPSPALPAALPLPSPPPPGEGTPRPPFAEGGQGGFSSSVSRRWDLHRRFRQCSPSLALPLRERGPSVPPFEKGGDRGDLALPPHRDGTFTGASGCAPTP